jgi:hypothetical protein
VGGGGYVPGTGIPRQPYGHTQPDRRATAYYWDNWCNTTFPQRTNQCKSMITGDSIFGIYRGSC